MTGKMRLSQNGIRQGYLAVGGVPRDAETAPSFMTVESRPYTSRSNNAFENHHRSLDYGRWLGFGKLGSPMSAHGVFPSEEITILTPGPLIC